MIFRGVALAPDEPEAVSPGALDPTPRTAVARVWGFGPHPWRDRGRTPGTRSSVEKFDRIIGVGTNPPTEVLAADYENNVITVAQSLFWAKGDGVSFDFEGGGPDIGAYEWRKKVPEEDGGVTDHDQPDGADQGPTNDRGSDDGGQDDSSRASVGGGCNCRTGQVPPALFALLGVLLVGRSRRGARRPR